MGSLAVVPLAEEPLFSVSWFLSFAIFNYIDEIVKELNNTEIQENILDNYDQNFIYMARMFGGIKGFLTLWGVPEEKYLNRLLL